MILSIEKIIKYTYNGDYDNKRNSHKTFQFKYPFFFSYSEVIGRLDADNKLFVYPKTGKLGAYYSHTTSKHVNWLYDKWEGEKVIKGHEPPYEAVEVEEGQTCPISLDIIENGVKTTCGHTFNQASIDTWLKVHKDCPLCRTILI